jgi:NAD-dependent deacetylase
MPPRCDCGGILKPDTVLFGEQLPARPLEAAYQAAMSCRSMLVVGTSAVVYPAAALPGVAKHNGALIIEINIERAFAEADVALLDKAATVLPELVSAIGAAMSH